MSDYPLQVGDVWEDKQGDLWTVDKVASIEDKISGYAFHCSSDKVLSESSTLYTDDGYFYKDKAEDPWNLIKLMKRNALPEWRDHVKASKPKHIPGSTCTLAHSLVTGDRKAQHGEFDSCFETIAALWNIYLKDTIVDITPADVSMMMVLMKVARVINGSGVNHDNAVDIAGYADLYNAIISKREGEKS